MSPHRQLLPSVPHDDADRVSLIKAANRLAMAFGVWAVVVAIVGTVGVVLLNRILTKVDANASSIIEVKGDVRSEVNQLQGQINVMRTGAGIPISLEADQRINRLESGYIVVDKRLDRIESRNGYER